MQEICVWGLCELTMNRMWGGLFTYPTSLWLVSYIKELDLQFLKKIETAQIKIQLKQLNIVTADHVILLKCRT